MLRCSGLEKIGHKHMKTCFKCKRNKPLTEFYRHPQMGDGRLGKCKDCTKKDVAENYRANIDHYVEYEKQRFKDPARKKKLLAYQRKMRAKRPGRARCANAVSNAIRDGRLVKQTCQVCGEPAQAHHDDYRRPLVVRWLCRKHHLEHHGKKSRG
jgi:hypothetical protein